MVCDETNDLLIDALIAERVTPRQHCSISTQAGHLWVFARMENESARSS